MKGQHLACAAILVLLASSTWGQTTTPGTGYTEKEYNALQSCHAITMTAWMGAIRKLNGTSLADAKKYYDGRVEAAEKDVIFRVFDKVYGDSFTNAWDYAVSFFGQCAQDIANVGKDRSSLASYCMQNSMIGGTAWDYKNSGQPAENAYQHFANLAGSAPHTIIDRVYAGSKSRIDVAWGEWQSCMKPLISQSGSAPPPPVQSIPPLGGLTDKEFAAMPPCVALAVSVWGIAENKQQGVRPEDVKKPYESQPDAAFMSGIADKVYADKFAVPGLYSLRYLDSCAHQKADVAPNRMGVANSCLTHAYISAKASAFKKNGASSDKAYEAFAEIYGTTAGTIVDKVYRSPDSNEGLGVAEWKTCVISSPTLTTNEKGQEVVIAAIPSGYQTVETKMDKGSIKYIYPKGQSASNWTERLGLEEFPELIDHTPTAFQKAIQGPSENCKDGKVTSSSVGEQDGYAFALWSETCAGSAGKTEFRFHKAIQGYDNLYLITRSFQFAPSEAQTQQFQSYMASVKVCDSKRSGQPCTTVDVWRP
ncbi:MAG TPA: hypothetical protein VN087_20405 [Verrucomicrobiae bacterium]|jgi:hypothetical protein|nr:hypothetical protein [Verrucomicrobiae bacterium]